MQRPENLHIVVCTPCFGGMVTQGYMLSAINLMLLGNHLGFEVTIDMLGNDSLVTRSRNTLVAQFLDRPEATHLLFVDADISFQPAQVLRMVQFDQDVVAGMYPLKIREWSAAAIERVRYCEPLDTAPLRYVGLPCEGEAITTLDGFVSAEYAGTGFLMIRRAALLRMMEAYPELAFSAAHDRGAQKPSPYRYALFDCMIEPETRHYLSEDYTFCRRWRDIGGQIWLDTRGALTHTGPHDFAGNPALRFSSRRAQAGAG